VNGKSRFLVSKRLKKIFSVLFRHPKAVPVASDLNRLQNTIYNVRVEKEVLLTNSLLRGMKCMFATH
jgi:hypothetical protein